MARQPHLPDGDRFFARIYDAVLECPRCGKLSAFHRGQGGRTKSPPVNRTWGGRKQTSHGYNPTTGRWKCPGCELICVLGLLAWPVKRGSRSISRPRDQVPTERELAQLRAEGSGLWMPEGLKRARADSTNVTARCSCRPGTANTSAGNPECPIHREDPGWKAPAVEDGDGEEVSSEEGDGNGE